MTDATTLRTAVNRRTAADLFASLDDAALRTPSLCEGWTCRDVLGHLVMCIETSVPRFVLEVVRDRGRSDVTSDRMARTWATRPVADLVATLRERAGDAVTQPGVGVGGPFADSCIHLRDVAVPLGLPTTPPVDDWVGVLGFLVTPKARAGGFLPRGRLDGLRLEATDAAWAHGDGELVTGRGEALAMSLTGRSAELDDLAGPGAGTLRRRVLEARRDR